jgi:hypothetical protein
MSNTAPHYAYWRTFPALKLWYFAAMMNGVDPHAVTDVIDAEGQGMDLSEDIQRLVGAALVGEVAAYPITGQLPNSYTEVSVASVVTWLRGRGDVDLANSLDVAMHDSQQVVPVSKTPDIPDAQRRLTLLRSLGGNIKFSQGTWRIRGIAKLENQENSDGRERTSPKTIRGDLIEAAKAELENKRATPFSGL